MTAIDLYDGITLHQGDCRDIMRSLPADHFDAVITDPPYGISFQGEKWDTATPTGFQSWAQSWGEEALRILKPGGYLLAFSAPRTYHRLTSGLEDAGFEIRDAMAWIRADGKPAGTDLSSAFDRDAGVLDQREGRVIERWDTSAVATDMSSYKTSATGKPITDEAKAWEGWGVGLKPAWEPIVVARRPLEGRLVDNVREHGTGHSLTQAVQLLPTPQAVNASRSSAGYGPNLHEVATALLPTPKAADGVMGLPRTSGRPPEKSTHLATRLEYTDYGNYAPAIARWEQITGRAAPHPRHPHADQEANPNYPRDSSNGSWAYQTATSPAPTWHCPANTNCDSSGTVSCLSKPP